jgi:hypothetical protein
VDVVLSLKSLWENGRPVLRLRGALGQKLEASPALLAERLRFRSIMTNTLVLKSERVDGAQFALRCDFQSPEVISDLPPSNVCVFKVHSDAIERAIPGFRRSELVALVKASAGLGRMRRAYVRDESVAGSAMYQALKDPVRRRALRGRVAPRFAFEELNWIDYFTMDAVGALGGLGALRSIGLETLHADGAGVITAVSEVPHGATVAALVSATRALRKLDRS